MTMPDKKSIDYGAKTPSGQYAAEKAHEEYGKDKKNWPLDTKKDLENSLRAMREADAEVRRETRGMKKGGKVKRFNGGGSTDSTRTKMLKEAPVDSDMGPIKRAVKAGAVKLSEMLDRAGMKQEQEYEGKSKEELAIKKRSGGMIGSASKRADGCAQRGKTRGKMV